MYYSISGISSQPKDTTTKVLLFVTLKSSTFCYFGPGADVLLSTHMRDPYHHIHDGEVFQKSRCIWHENIMMDFFRSQLTQLGYHSISESNKVWARGSRQVIVCLADDVFTCKPWDQPGTMPDAWDTNTTVITDNAITCATQYQVCQLPDSYFGIYSYQPKLSDWTPERRFNFSVNRLDAKRLMLFLELTTRTLYPRSRIFDLEQDLVNFNCWHWGSTNDSPDAFCKSFSKEFTHVPDVLQAVYRTAFEHMMPLMPYRNHEYSVEQSHVRAWLNMVIETYSSDSCIALSEKTFRALVTPVPFMVYAGRYTTARLTQMGFDLMSDLVKHRTDFNLEKQTGEFGDRMVDFVRDAHESVEAMKQLPFEQVQQRCQAAADHNQQLLAKMKQAWPADFAQWWAQVVERIK